MPTSQGGHGRSHRGCALPHARLWAAVGVVLLLGLGNLVEPSTALAALPGDGGGPPTPCGYADSLSVSTEPPLSTPAGTAFAFAVTAEQTGCGATKATGPVSVAITANTGTAGAALSCAANPVTAADGSGSTPLGEADFSCSIGTVGTGYTITATSTSHDNINNPLPLSVATTAFDITAAPPPTTPIVVDVSGSQTFGGSPSFSPQGAGLPAGVTGILSCTTVDGGTAISATLGAGLHTVDGGSCSGLSATDPTTHTVSYVGVVDGFAVNQATVTATISGSQTFGGTPSFSQTNNAPGGVSVLGTPTCATVGASTTITATLTVGSYTLLGSSCSGLSLSDPTDYALVYAGLVNGFVVGQATVTATISGSQTFGGSPSFSQTNDAPTGVFVTGTPTCTAVTPSTAITATLTAGSYTLLGSSCSGLSLSDPTDYALAYAGLVNGFVVSPATITANVSGSQTFGVTGSSVFGQTNDAPTGVSVTGTPTCTTVGGGTAIVPTLTAGTYTIDGSSCFGLTPSDSTDYVIAYSGVTNGFVVNRATITATVSGSQTYGTSGTTAFTQTNNAPGGVSVSGTLWCTSVDGGTTITSLLPGGTHTVDGSSCGGLLPSDATDYVVAYAGAANGFVVSRAATSLLYNNPQFVWLGSTFAPSATLSSPITQCMSGQSVSFSLDSNPLTGVPGTYPLGSATTGGTGLASVSPLIGTTGWMDGVYMVTASFAGTASCVASSYTASLAVASPGDAGSGGGWYTLSGGGRVNFAFTVHKVVNTTSTYTGQVVLINNGKWRLKGRLTAYGRTGTSALTGTNAGSGSGTGGLYWWNQALNGGLGDWQLAKSPVTFVITFSASGGGGKASPGSFGISISYTPVPPQPATLPNSTPQLLKGGTVKVS